MPQLRSRLEAKGHLLEMERESLLGRPGGNQQVWGENSELREGRICKRLVRAEHRGQSPSLAMSPNKSGRRRHQDTKPQWLGPSLIPAQNKEKPSSQSLCFHLGPRKGEETPGWRLQGIGEQLRRDRLNNFRMSAVS